MTTIKNENDYLAQIVNTESITAIGNRISLFLKRKITDVEAANLLSFIRGQKTHNWQKTLVPDVRSILAKLFLNKYFAAKNNAKEGMIDIHEMMKQHIGTPSKDPDFEIIDNVDINGKPISSAIIKVQNSTVVEFKKNYITLDTRYRQTAYSAGYQWTLLQNSTATGEGVVNSLGDNVKQITKIMCPNIRIPLNKSSDLIFRNAYKRVSLLIKELESQSNIANPFRYHFMFEASVDGNYINLKALGNHQQIFEFAKPILQLDTLTAVFGNPFEPVIFDLDRQNMAVTYSNPVVLTSTTIHNLTSGDLIYITAMTSLNPDADRANLQNWNFIYGHLITVIDPYNISIAYGSETLNGTLLTGPITPFSISVYFGSKRIIIPLELTYIDSSTTII